MVMTNSEILEITNSEKRYSYWNAIKMIQGGTPKDLIKERNGMLFISGDTVISMLNKIFNYQWSFVVVESKIENGRPNKNNQHQPDIAHALCRLVVPGIGVREQWGSAVLNGGSDIQQSAFKAATTDALKKCAVQFGIGIDVSSKYNPALSQYFSVQEQDMYNEEMNKTQFEAIQRFVKKRELERKLAQMTPEQRAAYLQQQAEVKKQRETRMKPLVSSTPDRQQQNAPIMGQVDPTPQIMHTNHEIQGQPQMSQMQVDPTMQKANDEIQSMAQEWPTSSTASQATVNSQQTVVLQEPEQSIVDDIQPETEVHSETPAPPGLTITTDEMSELKKLMLEAGLKHSNELNPFIERALQIQNANFSMINSDNIGGLYIELMQFIGTVSSPE